MSRKNQTDNKRRLEESAHKKRGFRPLAGGLKEASKRETAKSEPVYLRRVLSKGPQPKMQSGTMATMPAYADFELIDSGFGEKLERYGDYKIIRPEAQALWQPRLSEKTWEKADAVFTGSGGDEEDNGRWRFQNKLAGGAAEDAWPLEFEGVRFMARFTQFRHMGFFAEQAAHWAWFCDLIRNANRPVKVLNLFGYTGVASLVAAKAGASVTHVDASKKAIGWARENQELSGLGEKPIRWICDDAMKFIKREERRESFYDGIILDPPKYGRGPKGEVWDFFQDLPELMHSVRAILSEKPLFVILSSYAIRASFMASHELSRDVFSGLGGEVQSGELLIQESGSERAISTSLFTRWSEGNSNE